MTGDHHVSVMTGDHCVSVMTGHTCLIWLILDMRLKFLEMINKILEQIFLTNLNKS